MGEEFLFSGYYMKQLAELIGNTDRAWFISAIILSTLLDSFRFREQMTKRFMHN